MENNASSSPASNTMSGPSESQSQSQTATEKLLKSISSEDIGWKYGTLAEPGNRDKVKCNFYPKVVCGGVYRLKEHFAGKTGNVASCKRVSEQAKDECKANLDQTKKKKKEKENHVKEARSEVNIELGDELEDVGLKRKPPHTLGPMDQFTLIDPDDSINANKRMRQVNINDALFKKKTQDVHSFLARWVYESGISFNAINNDNFNRFVEPVGQFGPGYRPPSQYELREPLLKKEVERTKQSVNNQEEEWATNGCSIMTDAWSDRKRRSVMNLCVNCKEGTTFLSSKEASNDAHTGEYIFQYVDKCIEEIGPQHVTQVVTDNASNNMAATVLLKKKRPNIFWTSCATHTVNLMLEAIGKIPKFKEVIAKAKALTVFIYRHHKTLAMMRRWTKNKDIVRPGATRFATSFLTLQSLVEKKVNLRSMFTSEEWETSIWYNKPKGKMAYEVVMSTTFWDHVNLCLMVFAPLVKVLRLVDGDQKPTMPFLYGELEQAKEDIKDAFRYVEANYRPILDIIDVKRRGRLDTSLHLTAYFLNPLYFYKDPIAISNSKSIMEAYHICVEKFFPDDIDAQCNLLNVELEMYRGKKCGFRKSVAALGYAKNDDNYNPVAWWNTYGYDTPNLKRMAMRILSLTTSASECERNWSAFEGIHPKKRNRLDSTRLNDLVYVQFNARINKRKQRVKQKEVDVLLGSDASKAQSWIIDCDDEDVELDRGVLGDVVGVEDREIYGEDFVSDKDTDDEFESDDERMFG